MKTETTYKGKVEDWERLNERLTANAPELAHLEGTRARLEAMMAQARQIAATQAAQMAAKQQASQALKTAIAEGDRLANLLRAGVKQHYGIRAEKLTEFGVKPFRGRNRKTTEPETPGAPAVHPPAGSPQ
jgi:septal ring factor EnvC (AmiA/AmiB activator)